jgi:hypothetical protein
MKGGCYTEEQCDHLTKAPCKSRVGKGKFWRILYLIVRHLLFHIASPVQRLLLQRAN